MHRPIDILTWFRKAGKYCGYPQCCIEAFIKQHIAGQRWSEREPEVVLVLCRDIPGSGFVPCVECASKILRGEATLASLISNRECRFDFPFDDVEAFRVRLEKIEEEKRFNLERYQPYSLEGKQLERFVQTHVKNKSWAVCKGIKNSLEKMEDWPTGTFFKITEVDNTVRNPFKNETTIHQTPVAN